MSNEICPKCGGPLRPSQRGATAARPEFAPIPGGVMVLRCDHCEKWYDSAPGLRPFDDGEDDAV